MSLKPRPFRADDTGLSVGRFAMTAHTTTAEVAALVTPGTPAVSVPVAPPVAAGAAPGGAPGD